MVYGRQPHPRLPSFGGTGAGLPPPKDLIVLLVVVFATFSMRFFETTAFLPRLLELTSFVWQYGLVWQLVTYPLAGRAGGGFWFLLELLILFWFGRDVFYHLGRRRFWATLAVGAVAGSVVAVVADVVSALVAGAAYPQSFVIMQGQHMLIVLVIAAFATLYSDATIYLFFVLPVKAKWFLGLEVLFAFMAFLPSRDLPGFLGICTAVGATWLWLQPRGPGRTFRELWLRSQKWWIEQRMRRLRRKRGFQVLPGDKGRGGGGGGGYLN